MSENEIREYALMKATFKWLLIGMLWQGLELWFYGTTRPSNEDTIIGFLLWYYIVRCECMKRGSLVEKRWRQWQKVNQSVSHSG